MNYFNTKNFVECLDEKVVDTYEDWIILGKYLHNINNNLNYLNLWIEKSKSSITYSYKYENIDQVCNNIWNGMINNNNNNHNIHNYLKLKFMNKSIAPIGDI